MLTILHKKMRNIPSMRQFAIGAWRKPTDPSVHVQLDVDITALMAFLESYPGVTLHHVMVKLLSIVLKENPALNTIIVRGSFRQRLTNRLFIPVAYRRRKHMDLSGIFMDNAYAYDLMALKTEWDAKIRALRYTQTEPVHRAIRLFEMLPTMVVPGIIRLLDFIQYTCNISLKPLGLPCDPFGSGTITFLNTFGIRYADVPLYPFSRSAFNVAVGTPYTHDNHTQLPLTVTFDHRVMDGYESNRAYKSLKKYLENPHLLAPAATVNQ